MLGSQTTTKLPTRPIVIIPMGSTEQHGPHLPLDTDSRIATAWAQSLNPPLTALAERPVCVAPTMNYGASGEHAGFAGTMSIGTEVTVLVMAELARSIREWAGPVVFLSGHAGNLEAMLRAGELLASEGHIVESIVPVLAGSDAHAGRTETSLMLHIAPDLVDLTRAAAGRTEPIGELIDDLRAFGIRRVSPTGVLGDPSGANAAEGSSLLTGLVQHALDQISASSILR